ncbi:hypothetical protein CCACVL1_15416 [Corchorus capsularis]|uniref:Uncharacterized protein n=1 Tax=Corchorus capsularis TaxID=210143 RepID=A0A1R3I2L7_COCAP|nr:hypothetical protein CCACVL1_15416 [Corchorus capsularis]
MEIRQEMEQERKMLQMAEVLREERVQMKLSDAKLALEKAHEEWSKLKTSSNGGVLTLAGTLSSPWTIFPIRKSIGRIGHQRYSMGQWGVKDLVNPHIARGIKGCIESSRGNFQKNTVKAKLWEAMIDSEKAELQTD